MPNQGREREYPLFDYDKILYDNLIQESNGPDYFKNKHLWVKKATGIGF
jgi:hypothetical protein